MNPQDLSIKNFTYDLPEEKIAKKPLAARDASRLLIYREEKIIEDTFQHIANYIPENALLLFNNTKVVEARLIFQKSSGAHIEIFCLEPDKKYNDISSALSQKEKVYWKCLVGGASKWKKGQVLEKIVNVTGETVRLTATFITKEADSFIIELSWTPTHYSFAEILHFAGAIPLPPYIKREVEASDAERYQTIYALTDGSVAAPTAGLHFTDQVFDSLKQKGIQYDFLTLHVGAGTFKPVKSDSMQNHQMHAELIEVKKEVIQLIRDNLEKDIIPVGTTSLRTIESLYWLGIKLHSPSRDEDDSIPFISQWFPYENIHEDISASSALDQLLKWMGNKGLNSLLAKTEILIAPGYKPRIAKGLVTNFHQPGSTLLLLVAALIGEKWRDVYDYALKNDFRFLSYGDGCLLYFK